MDLPAPNDGQVSPSDNNDNKKDEHYHVHFAKKMKAASHVPCKSGRQQQAKSVKPVVTSILKKIHPTFLDDDLDFGNNFTDTVLMGLDFLGADLNGPGDVTNPFNFDM